MRFGAAQDLAEQHARQREIGGIDVLAGDLADAVYPIEALARDTAFMSAHDALFVSSGHEFSWRAAAITASTIFWYPVQRHRVPDSASRTSASLGIWPWHSSRNDFAVMIMPGMQ